MRSDEYATGEAKSPSWIRNGTTYRMSRYLTFKAESQMPTASAAVNASAVRGRSHNTASDGRTPKYSIIRPSTTMAIAKSSRVDPIAETGRSSRGKYTFWMRFEAMTRLLEDPTTLCENSVHGTRPANAK